jgi:hypothetical protein
LRTESATSNFESKKMKNFSATRELIQEELSAKGYVILPNVLSKAECDFIQNFYNDSSRYRNTINMERYRFGKGEYKYFNYPLPSKIQELREEFYKPLVSVANVWNELLSIDKRFPDHHHELIEICKQHGQLRPTPLILRYEKGGFNTLHQDLYGEVYFPFQMLIVLSQRGIDFEGGEFVMTEQMPRAQSKAHVLTPNQGDAVIFTTNYRPVSGTGGFFKTKMKHGVSELTAGMRYALGIIFHDAE